MWRTGERGAVAGAAAEGGGLARGVSALLA